jgi:hypothetical protein
MIGTTVPTFPCCVSWCCKAPLRLSWWLNYRRYTRGAAEGGPSGLPCAAVGPPERALSAHRAAAEPFLYGFKEPTTTEVWATGLGVAPQRARRPRVEAADALPLRCSARLRQRLE